MFVRIHISPRMDRHSHTDDAQKQGTTFQSGEDAVVRAQFVNNGVLSNSQDTQFRAVQDRWPVFAFAHDLGSVNAASALVVISVGHVRDPAVQYIVAGGQIQSRSLYFWSKFSFINDAVRATDLAERAAI